MNYKERKQKDPLMGKRHYQNRKLKIKSDPKYKAKRYNYTYQRSKKLRLTLMEMLGGIKCNCNGINCWHEGNCLVTDPRCLQIDHKNGGGTKERLEKKATSLYLFYTKNPMLANNELQTLCSNCNWIKRYLNNESGNKFLNP